MNSGGISAFTEYIFAFGSELSGDLKLKMMLWHITFIRPDPVTVNIILNIRRYDTPNAGNPVGTKCQNNVHLTSITSI